MKNEVHIRNAGELLSGRKNDAGIRNRVNCMTFDYKEISTRFPAAGFLNASIAILVLSGTSTVTINYKSHSVHPDNIILLSSSHLFHFSGYSSDFKCICLLVSKEFTDEMDSTDMIYRRIRYGVRLYSAPVISLETSQTLLLRERMSGIGKAIATPEHLYYKEMILNALFAFYLDLSNIIESRAGFEENGNPTRYESIIQAFIKLLADNYRKEHKVEYYASRLNLSAHYLTLIVKRITGQSVCDLIFEMLYSEARNLLSHSRLSIQEIAILLNFSDQSSFGKFFRRKAGISPADYRKQQ